MTSLTIPGSAPALSSFPDLPGTVLTNDQQTVVDLAWLKIEDAFDSQYGGPYLQDITKNGWGPQKTALFFPFAMNRINYTIPNPISGPFFNINTFDWANNYTLFAQALTLENLMHCVRSYVEMPQPEGTGNITWLSRMEYKMRWEEIYKQEEEQFLNWLRVFKRNQLNLGRVKGILHFKAGRLMPLPMRTRVPRTYGW